MKVYRPVIWVAPDASPATTKIPTCCAAPQTSTRTSLCVTSYGVLRSACYCFQKSTPYTRTRVDPHDIHESTSDVLYVSSCRTLTIRPCYQFSVPDRTCWLFTKKIMEDPLFFSPVLTKQIRGRKQIARAKFQTRTIENEGVSNKPLELCLPFFVGGHYTPVTSENVPVPPHRLVPLL